MQIDKHAKKPQKTRGRINVAVLLIIAIRSVLPILISQGFVEVVALVEISVMNIVIPLFRLSIGPQEKEPPDGLL
jgi:hypothetical protein